MSILYFIKITFIHIKVHSNVKSTDVQPAIMDIKQMTEI